MREDRLLTVGEVAVLIGLSPHTIRSWEQRYGFRTPRRSGGNQRRYSMDDVETLRRVKQIRARRGVSLKLAIEEATGAVPQAQMSAIWPGPTSATASDGLWRKAADLYVGPLVMIGPRGYILDCNLAFADLIGRDRAELLGLPFVDLVVVDDRFKAAQLHRRPLARRQGWELTLKVAAGQPRTCSFEGAPAEDEGVRALICLATSRPAVAAEPGIESDG